ncbi:MAG: hypothetical protein AAGF31_10940 [Planctomycetota bacterium]
MPKIPLLSALLIALVGVVGCEKRQEQPPAPASVAASVTLHVTVAEDAALAAAIERLRGEWTELSGGELEVRVMPADEVLADSYLRDEERPKADLLVFPSRWLGELCEADRLRPIRESVLSSEQLAFDDFFPLVREREIVYGDRVMALPLGCPTPLFAFQPRGDGPADPPLWSDLPESSACRVLGEVDEQRQWAYLFLARAATYGSQSTRDELLFDSKTMAPRLSEPPFLRAMQEMQHGVFKHEASTAPIAGNRVTVAGVLLGLGRRETVMWPIRSEDRVTSSEATGETAAERQRFEAAAETLRVAPLPGSAEIYSSLSSAWESVDGSPQQVTLLATSGQLLGVTTTTRNAASAFRLATWLASKQNGRQISMASGSVANPRRSLARLADDWSGVGSQRLGKQFAQAHAQSLQAKRAFTIPRLVRIDDYLTALGDAVRQVGSGDISPEQALQNLIAEWEQLTDTVGRQEQLRAYRRHLGIEKYEPAKR